MKLNIFKKKKTAPKQEVNDLIPKGIGKTFGKKLPFNEMGEKQLPSSTFFTSN